MTHSVRDVDALACAVADDGGTGRWLLVALSDRMLLAAPLPPISDHRGRGAPSWDDALSLGPCAAPVLCLLGFALIVAMNFCTAVTAAMRRNRTSPLAAA